jgi:hypothetical protein
MRLIKEIVEDILFVVVGTVVGVAGLFAAGCVFALPFALAGLVMAVPVVVILWVLRLVGLY